MLKTHQIRLDSKVLQIPGNIVSDMDGEKVMLNIENGRYYNLGKLGGEIWGYMKKEISIDNLILNLIDEYEIDKIECEQEVIAFIASLHEEGLIKIIE